jgi:hypothetical protein
MKNATGRPSTYAFAFLAILTLGVIGIFAFSGALTAAHQPRLDANRRLVEQFGLTDLALFTEARYTRHPSQADLHSALQDHPGAFDHFPSGSLLPPPAILIRNRAESHDAVAGKTTSPD